MSHEIPKESSAFMSPDSLRQMQESLKHFYDGHIKKTFSTKDINGSQYAGTMENYGSEILLESRKLRMNKPALDQLFVKNTMDDYFDIEYSNMINTYDQQNMLVARLKKGVLLDNYEYRLVFTDCDEACIIRSESWSDRETQEKDLEKVKITESRIYKEYYYHTTTSPKLIAMDQEIDMVLEMDNDVTDYYFYKGPQPITDKFVLAYEDNTLTVILNKTTETLPMIWMCPNKMRFLPKVELEDAVDMNGNPFFAFGTDGDNRTFLFPFVVHQNIPYDTNGEWYLRAILAHEDAYLIQKPKLYDEDYQAKITAVQFIEVPELDGGIHHTQATIAKTIYFPTDGVKFTLGTDKWQSTIPVEGDAFYDGITFRNPPFAYINLKEFDHNCINSISEKYNMIPAIRVIFDRDYENPYSRISGNGYSGIHIDTGSEHSENGVSKKYGTIHDLGDFDGLPEYFHYYRNKDIQRSRVELYTIKDENVNVNQKAKNRYTSALILDSGYPRESESSISENLNFVLMYDFLTGSKYTYRSNGIERKSISPRNSLSEITYLSNNHFGNYKLKYNKNRPRFIYHGNRHFSLSFAGLNNETETSRVYVITNDPIDYENNELVSIDKKPERTLARICDIPTSFTQLIHVDNMSPTLVIDDKYVRSEADFNRDTRYRLYNGLPKETYKLLTMGNYKSENDAKLWEHTYASLIPLDDSSGFEATVQFDSVGTDYVVGDTFISVLCGVTLDGTITEVDDNGGVVSFDLDAHDYSIPYENFGPLHNYTVLGTTTTKGKGSGLKILLHISSDYLKNNTISLSDDRYRDTVISFEKDEFGFWWIAKYNKETGEFDKSYQLTGEAISENIYGSQSDIAVTQRKNVDTFLYNMLGNVRKHITRFEDDVPLNVQIENKSSIFGYQTWHPFTVSPEISIISKIPIEEDLSSELSHLNSANMLYYAQETGKTDNEEYRYTIHMNKRFLYGTSMEFPRFHHLNLPSILNNASYLIMTEHPHTTGFHVSQPDVYFMNPFKSTMDDYTFLAKDMWIRKDTHDITFEKYLPLMIYDRRLLTSVYEFNIYKQTTDRENFEATIRSHNRDELIKYITNYISTMAEPLAFEGTDYAWEKEHLISYILTSVVPDLNNKGEIQLLREYDEEVIDQNGNAIGTQPEGELVCASTDVFDDTVKISNYGDINVDQLFLFKLDDPGYFHLKTLNGFMMKDEEGFDISDKVILYFRNALWIMTDKSRYIWSEIVFN